MKTAFAKLFLVLAGLSIALFGCGPGTQLVVRPDVHISGDFSGPRYPYSGYYDYGYYFPYVTIVPVNGTPYELELFINGRRAEIQLENGVRINRLPPGMPAKISAFVDYRVSRQVSVVAVAYKNGKVIGSASRVFHFYGSPNRQQVIDWPLRVWDFR